MIKLLYKLNTIEQRLMSSQKSWLANAAIERISWSVAKKTTNSLDYLMIYFVVSPSLSRSNCQKEPQLDSSDCQCLLRNSIIPSLTTVTMTSSNKLGIRYSDTLETSYINCKLGYVICIRILILVRIQIQYYSAKSWLSGTVVHTVLTNAHAGIGSGHPGRWRDLLQLLGAGRRDTCHDFVLSKLFIIHSLNLHNLNQKILRPMAFKKR